MQALQISKDMNQSSAFSALLAVAMSEASRVNARAQAAVMSQLRVSMLITNSSVAEALSAGQQVTYCIIYCIAL